MTCCDPSGPCRSAELERRMWYGHARTLQVLKYMENSSKDHGGSPALRLSCWLHWLAKDFFPAQQPVATHFAAGRFMAPSATFLASTFSFEERWRLSVTKWCSVSRWEYGFLSSELLNPVQFLTALWHPNTKNGLFWQDLTGYLRHYCTILYPIQTFWGSSSWMLHSCVHGA